MEVSSVLLTNIIQKHKEEIMKTRQELIDLIEKEIRINPTTLSMHHSAIKTLAKKYPDEVNQFLEITNSCVPSTPTYRYKFLKRGLHKMPNCCNPSCNKLIGHFDRATCLDKECQSYNLKKCNLEKYGVENVFQLNTIKDKIKSTNIKKYGVENPSQSETIKQKKIDTCQKNYGVNNPQQSKIVKLKSENTNLKKYGFRNVFQNEMIKDTIKKVLVDKYGVENPSQSETIKQKKIDTCQKNYGVDYFLQSEFGQETTKKSCITKYGVDNVFKCSKIKQKIKDSIINKYGGQGFASEILMEKINKTNLERYGAKYPMQNSIIAEKSFQNSFKKKEYTWFSGESIFLQGFEPIVLRELESAGHSFNDVLTSKADMPTIWYIGEDNKSHRYYPDFYIPKDNLIIEVKSEYTMLNNFYNNNLKFIATKKLGFNFKLEVR